MKACVILAILIAVLLVDVPSAKSQTSEEIPEETQDGSGGIPIELLGTRQREPRNGQRGAPMGQGGAPKGQKRHGWHGWPIGWLWAKIKWAIKRGLREIKRYIHKALKKIHALADLVCKKIEALANKYIAMIKKLYRKIKKLCKKIEEIYKKIVELWKKMQRKFRYIMECIRKIKQILEHLKKFLEKILNAFEQDLCGIVIEPGQLNFTSRGTSCKGLIDTQGGWCAKNNTVVSDAITIDLSAPKTVQGVSTQGRSTSFDWVTSYYVEYGNDSLTLQFIMDGNAPKVFPGNVDSNTIKSNKFPIPLTARYFRITPLDFTGDKCMRVGLFDCSDCESLITFSFDDRKTND